MPVASFHRQQARGFRIERFSGLYLGAFGMSYPVDLIHIPIGDACVTVGMDWLSIFHDMIDCE